MPEDENITYDQIKKQGTKSTKIIVTRTADNNDIFLEMEDKTKKEIGKNIDMVSLYGVRTSPEAGGPFFITVIEEGILNVHEEVLYKIHVKNMRIYIPIW